MDLPISEDRLRADIEATAEFGAIDAPEGRGRTVLTGTDANRAAREYLVERLDDAGLDTRIDAVGNIAGRWTPASADPEAPAVASGSHLDHRIEVTAARDRWGLGVGARGGPPTGDVADGVDPDVEARVVQSLPEVVPGSLISIGAGKDGAAPAFRRVDRAELGGGFDVRP